MKWISVLGLVVLFEIAASYNVKIEIKKGHDHKKNHVAHEPRSPPAVRDGQKDFMKYLDKWDKFSVPEARWHPTRKTHGEEHIKKHHKIVRKKGTKDTDQLVNTRRQNIRRRLQMRKKNRLAGRRTGNRFSRRNNHKNTADHSKKRFHLNHQRNYFYDTLKKGFGKKYHQELSENKKHTEEQTSDRKEHELKSDKRFRGDRIKQKWNRGSHQFGGRAAHGPKPFARGSQNGLEARNAYCEKRQAMKCPDYKREVCGSDGKTYQNRCLLAQEMCKKDNKLDMKLVKRGACEEKILH